MSAQLAGAGEVLAVLVEGDGHDTVGGIECFFDAVTVMHVDVDIKYARVKAEELDDAEDDVCETCQVVLGGSQSIEVRDRYH